MKSKVACVCEAHVVHDDQVRRAEASMPSDGLIQDAAVFFKVLGDPARIRIIQALSVSELCVCDLTAVLAMKQPAVSQHLKTLRQTGFVKYRKDGKIVYYSLADKHVRQIYALGLVHIQEKQGGA